MTGYSQPAPSTDRSAAAIPYGPFGAKQRERHVDSSDQAISELY